MTAPPASRTLNGSRSSSSFMVVPMDAQPTGESHETYRTNVPLYRVNYWEQPGPGYGWNLDAWLLKGCTDVTQAMAWAEQNANGRRFELLATPDSEAETDQLILLHGENPN
jgi:hypothetical protein